MLLLLSLALFSSTADATTVRYVEAERFASYGDWATDTNGELLSETWDRAWNTDYAVVHRTRILDPSVGDEFAWVVKDPNGRDVQTYYGAYEWVDAEEDFCLTSPSYSSNLCGFITENSLWSWPIWVYGDEPGTYEVEVWRNNAIAYVQPFELIEGEPRDLLYPVSSTSLRAPAGDTLDPLVVQLRDRFGDPVEGELVTFELTDKPGGAKGASLTDTLVQTDASGIAQTTFTLGSRDGTYVVTASGGDVGDVLFTAEAAAPAAAVTGVYGIDTIPLAASDAAEEYIAYRGALVDGQPVQHDGFPIGAMYDTPMQFDITVEADADVADDLSIAWTAHVNGDEVDGGEAGITGYGATMVDASLDLTVPRPTERVKGKPVPRAMTWADFGAGSVVLDFEIFLGDLPIAEQQLTVDLRLFWERDAIDTVGRSSNDVPNWLLYGSNAPSVRALEEEPVLPDRAAVDPAHLPPPAPLLPQMLDELMMTEDNSDDDEQGTILHTVGAHAHRYRGNGCSVHDAYWRPMENREAWNNGRSSDIVICGPSSRTPSLMWLATAIVHEHTHMTDWYYFWGEGHADQLPLFADSWVDGDPESDVDSEQPNNMPDMYECVDLDGDGAFDFDNCILDAEHFGYETLYAFRDSPDHADLRAAIQAEDWSYPGVQSDVTD